MILSKSNHKEPVLEKSNRDMNFYLWSQRKNYLHDITEEMLLRKKGSTNCIPISKKFGVNFCW